LITFLRKILHQTLEYFIELGGAKSSFPPAYAAVLIILANAGAPEGKSAVKVLDIWKISCSDVTYLIFIKIDLFSGDYCSQILSEFTGNSSETLATLTFQRLFLLFIFLWYFVFRLSDHFVRFSLFAELEICWAIHGFDCFWGGIEERSLLDLFEVDQIFWLFLWLLLAVFIFEELFNSRGKPETWPRLYLIIYWFFWRFIIIFLTALENLCNPGFVFIFELEEVVFIAAVAEAHKFVIIRWRTVQKCWFMWLLWNRINNFLFTLAATNFLFDFFFLDSRINRSLKQGSSFRHPTTNNLQRQLHNLLRTVSQHIIFFLKLPLKHSYMILILIRHFFIFLF